MIIGGKLVKQFTVDVIIFGIIGVNRENICSTMAMYSDIKHFGAVVYMYSLIITYVKIQLKDSP